MNHILSEKKLLYFWNSYCRPAEDLECLSEKANVSSIKSTTVNFDSAFLLVYPVLFVPLVLSVTFTVCQRVTKTPTLKLCSYRITFRKGCQIKGKIRATDCHFDALGKNVVPLHDEQDLHLFSCILFQRFRRWGLGPLFF